MSESQSHRPDLVNSDGTVTSVNASVPSSQSHRPDLVNSDDERRLIDPAAGFCAVAIPPS